MGRPCSSRISAGPSSGLNRRRPDRRAPGWRPGTARRGRPPSAPCPRRSAACGGVCAARRRHGPRRAGLERDRPDGHVGVGARGPRVRRRRQRRSPSSAPAITVIVDGPAGGVALHQPRDVLVPEHREVRLHQLVAAPAGSARSGTARAGSGRSASSSGKHLGVHDAGAGGQPLHVAHAEARGGAQRIGVIDVAGAHDGHRLEAAVRMLREARAPRRRDTCASRPCPRSPGRCRGRPATRRARADRCPPDSGRRGGRRTGTGRRSASGSRAGDVWMIGSRIGPTIRRVEERVQQAAAWRRDPPV